MATITAGDAVEWVKIKTPDPPKPTLEQIAERGAKHLRDQQWIEVDGINLVKMFKELYADLSHRGANFKYVARVADEIKRQVPNECPAPKDMRFLVFAMYLGAFNEPIPELRSPTVIPDSWPVAHNEEDAIKASGEATATLFD